MPKLKLDVEALAVETFATEASKSRHGTVLGAQALTVQPNETPVEDTKCTAPCMSGRSFCPIASCGSTCEAGSCYAACFAQTAAA